MLDAPFFFTCVVKRLLARAAVGQGATRRRRRLALGGGATGLLQGFRSIRSVRFRLVHSLRHSMFVSRASVARARTLPTTNTVRYATTSSWTSSHLAVWRPTSKPSCMGSLLFVPSPHLRTLAPPGVEAPAACRLPFEAPTFRRLVPLTWLIPWRHE